jgi:hypothetical protein
MKSLSAKRGSIPMTTFEFTKIQDGEILLVWVHSQVAARPVQDILFTISKNIARKL